MSVPSPLVQTAAAVPREFDAVASSYDRLTSLDPGYHRQLRISARRLELEPGARVLDLCCGTGASTEAILRAFPTARVTALDASAGMLAVAERKASLRGVRFVHGDATDPTLAGLEGPFDAALMAYGIRNLAERDRALANVLALLRPGGRAVFHEYSLAGTLRSKMVWDAVCWGIIIPGGLLFAGSSRIYRYLHRSVHEFDPAERFAARLARAGFADVDTRTMDGWQRDIVHSFRARRPG